VVASSWCLYSFISFGQSINNDYYAKKQWRLCLLVRPFLCRITVEITNIFWSKLLVVHIPFVDSGSSRILYCYKIGHELAPLCSLGGSRISGRSLSSLVASCFLCPWYSVCWLCWSRLWILPLETLQMTQQEVSQTHRLLLLRRSKSSTKLSMSFMLSLVLMFAQSYDRLQSRCHCLSKLLD